MAVPRILGAMLLAGTCVLTSFVSLTRAAQDGADPLEPLAWAVGGTWAADIKTSNGEPLHVEAIFDRSRHKKAITYFVTFKTKDKSVTQYEGTYFWHPGKKAI